jgi:hypothetical protein
VSEGWFATVARPRRRGPAFAALRLRRATFADEWPELA